MIEKSSIESSILVKTRREADVVTSSGPNGRFPVNVSNCYTQDLWRVGDRSGGASSVPLQKYRGPPRLSENVDQELEKLRTSLQRVVDTLRLRAKESHDLGKEIEKTDRERIQIKREMAGTEKDLRRNIKVIDELKSSLEEEEPVNIQLYEESKQKDLEEIETMKKQYEPIVAQKQVIKDSMEPLRQRVIELNDAISSQESRGSKIRVCPSRPFFGLLNCRSEP